MSGRDNQRSAFSLGQLAARWGIGVDRVRQLVETGELEGAFRLPSAGKYSCTIRIPLESVELAESAWAIDPSEVRLPMQTLPSKPRTPGLGHFPELETTSDEPAVECREAEKR
jgi:hypothetical protein